MQTQEQLQPIIRPLPNNQRKILMDYPPLVNPLFSNFRGACAGALESAFSACFAFAVDLDFEFGSDRSPSSSSSQPHL